MGGTSPSPGGSRQSIVAAPAYPESSAGAPPPVRKWAESRRSDQVFQEYRREYKRRFAWIKTGKITEEQFAVWHKAAKARKKECDREVISLGEFKAWLRNSQG